MAADKLAALARAGLTILQAALPLQHRPAGKIIFGQLTEHPFEVDLSVAGRAETPGPLLPGLVSTVDAIAPVAAKFGVLDVKRFNTRMIGNDSNLLIVFYVQIMPDDFVMQLHRF